jgi:hypothetical protein
MVTNVAVFLNNLLTGCDLDVTVGGVDGAVLANLNGGKECWQLDPLGLW